MLLNLVERVTTDGNYSLSHAHQYQNAISANLKKKDMVEKLIM